MGHREAVGRSGESAHKALLRIERHSMIEILPKTTIKK